MKKTKILIPLTGIIALAPIVPTMLTSCGNRDAKTIKVFLYAGEGTFDKEGTTSIKKLSVEVVKGKALKTATGYVEPDYLVEPGVKDTTNYKFSIWRDQDGNTLTGDSVVNDEFVAQAYFKENEDVASVSFKQDNWAVLAKHCSSAQEFCKTYMKDLEEQPQTESDAIDRIREKISTEAALIVDQTTADAYPFLRTISYYTPITYASIKVRLIDVGRDVATDNSKTTFTFEFVDTVEFTTFDPNGAEWYQVDEETGEEKSAFLRTYCNEALPLKLPLSVSSKLVAVNKTQKVTSEEGITQSDLMFPIARQEMGIKDHTGATYEPSDYTYTFYRNITDPGTTGKQMDSAAYDKYYFDYSETEIPYWTRTRWDSTNGYYFAKSGLGHTHRGFGRALAPLFNI